MEDYEEEIEIEKRIRERKEKIREKLKERAESIMEEAEKEGYIRVKLNNKTYEFYPDDFDSYEIDVIERKIVFYGMWKMENIMGEDVLGLLFNIEIPNRLRFILGKYVAYCDDTGGLIRDEKIIEKEALDFKLNEIYSFFQTYFRTLSLLDKYIILQGLVWILGILKKEEEKKGGEKQWI